MLIFPLSTENCCNLLLIVLTSEGRLRLSLNLSLLNIIWVILPNEHVVATLVTVEELGKNNGLFVPCKEI